MFRHRQPYLSAWWFRLRQHETLCYNKHQKLTWSIFGHLVFLSAMLWDRTSNCVKIDHNEKKCVAITEPRGPAIFPIFFVYMNVPQQKNVYTHLYTSQPCPANLLGSRLSPCLPPILAFSWSMSVLRSLTMASRKSKEPSSPFCPRLPGSPLQPLGPVSPGAPGGPTAPRLQAQ